MLLAKKVNNFTLIDVNINNNNCTGIRLFESLLRVKNLVELTENYGRNGGGFDLMGMSGLKIATSAELSIINNTADTHGGGILLSAEEVCADPNFCFLEFEDYVSISFSGNSACQGGDVVYGLSNCITKIDGEFIVLNKCAPIDIFWDLVSSTNNLSQSTFVEYERRVAFCTNTSEDVSRSGATCSDSHMHCKCIQGANIHCGS